MNLDSIKAKIEKATNKVVSNGITKPKKIVKEFESIASSLYELQYTLGHVFSSGLESAIGNKDFSEFIVNSNALLDAYVELQNDYFLLDRYSQEIANILNSRKEAFITKANNTTCYIPKDELLDIGLVSIRNNKKELYLVSCNGIADLMEKYYNCHPALPFVENFMQEFPMDMVQSHMGYDSQEALQLAIANEQLSTIEYFKIILLDIEKNALLEANAFSDEIEAILNMGETSFILSPILDSPTNQLPFIYHRAIIKELGQIGQGSASVTKDGTWFYAPNNLTYVFKE